MREILFKAKRKDDNIWVYGDLLHYSNGIVIIISAEDVSMVDPETVCQYTGLDDINGNKIFEGDIISSIYINGSIADCKVLYDNGCFWVEQFLREKNTDYLYNHIKNSKIIGNIHDNH